MLCRNFRKNMNWVAEANKLFACLMKVPINFWQNSYLFDKKDYFSSTKRWWWTPGQGWVQRMYCSRRGSVMTRQLWPRLDDSKGGVIGKGSSVINEAVHFGKRKRDESGSGAGGMVPKKRCVNQYIITKLFTVKGICYSALCICKWIYNRLLDFSTFAQKN